MPEGDGPQVGQPHPQVAAAPEGRLGYLPALDGLRAIAVLSVVVLHTWEKVLPAGFIGVDIFFVLSGFLITSILLREHGATGKISIKRFYGRRALRLFPALAALVIATESYALISGSTLAHDTTRALPFVLFYGANWAKTVGGLNLGLFEQTWSLAIEEQFYLVWPILLIVLLRAGPGVALAAAMAGAVTSTLIGIFLIQGSPSGRIFYGSDTRAVELLVGCGLALAVTLRVERRIGERTARWMFVAGAALLAAFALLGTGQDAFLYYGGMLLVSVACAAVIVRLAIRPSWVLQGLLSSAVPRHIGRISYGIYLWHAPISMLLPVSQGPLKTGIVLALTLVAAEASYRWVEMPFLRIKGRLT